ncbi:MAG TPA: ABC transporter substrate-binding protein [Pyrinomonadaceae bacterium]|jgi:NitT/TauT family transport system substrate-binding protein
MKKRTIGIVVIFIILIIAVIAYQIYSPHNVTQESTVIRIGYKPNSGYQHFFIAQEKGYFKKYGLNVEGVTFESTNQMVQAVVNGDLDATAASSIEVIGLVEQNSPNLLKIYLTLVFDKDHAFHSVLVPPDSKIQTLADLKGKKIGTVPGSTSQSWLEIILGRFFDSKKDVQIIQLEPRLQLQALSSGQVDALYTVDPIVAQAQAKGLARVLIKGPENEYMFTPMATGGAVVSQRLVQNNPEAAKNLIRAMNDAVDFMRTNDSESRQIIAKDTKLEANVAAKLDLLQLWKINETDLSGVQKYLDFLAETKILTKRIAAEDIYLNRSFIQ